MANFLQYFKDIGTLFFPRLCYACEEASIQQGEILCAQCAYELKIKDYHKYKKNELLDFFEGRVSLESVAAMYHFTEGSRVQNMVHHLKYKNAYRVGVKLGQQFGARLATVPHFQSVDVIVPVPLHPKKKRERGYNQSEAFSEGLSLGMQKSHVPNGLKRIKYGSSLTQKNRHERFSSIENAYVLNEKTLLSNKHVLLVDDVLTTGATIEVCAGELLKLSGTKVSVVVIAKAIS